MQHATMPVKPNPLISEKMVVNRIFGTENTAILKHANTVRPTTDEKMGVEI